MAEEGQCNCQHSAPQAENDRATSHGNHPRRLALRGSEIQLVQSLAITQHDLAGAGKSEHPFIIKLRQCA
jgi:hypothetical protein